MTYCTSSSHPQHLLPTTAAPVAFRLYKLQVEPQRAFGSMRLPCAGLPAVCALLHQPDASHSLPPAASGDGRGGSFATPGDEDVGGASPDRILLMVATAGGFLYQYDIEGLNSSISSCDGDSAMASSPQRVLAASPTSAPLGAPRCSLSGEWSLLGSARLSSHSYG
jgi:hypothetical protein